jgi:hypothetical protein
MVETLVVVDRRSPRGRMRSPSGPHLDTRDARSMGHASMSRNARRRFRWVRAGDASSSAGAEAMVLVATSVLGIVVDMEEVSTR